MEADNRKSPPVTKEEAIRVMQQLADELGRVPKREDLPEHMIFL